MINKLLGVVAVAAAVFAVVPAQAAHMGVGCNGSGFAKAESAVEASADGPSKMEAQKEVAAAQAGASRQYAPARARRGQMHEPGAKRAIDDFDRDIIQYVLTWASYGGPPGDEIHPRFGFFDYERCERAREIAFRGLERQALD